MAKQTFTTGQVLTAAQMTSLQQTAMLGGAASAKTASYTLVAADAGTAISMSNAGATTITVNTALFAAGDTVHITNLGAGVCTITAGTATVNSSASLALAQYESGFLDFTSTSAAIFVKGAGASTASRTAIGCAVYSSATQSLTNNVLTALTWDTETYDTNGFHSTSSNTSRITIPSGYDGKYRIGGLVSFHPNGTGRRELQLYKNGAALSYGNTVIGNGSEFIGTYMDWSTTLVAGDYVELYALQSSGGALVCYTTILNAQFSIDYLGA